MKKSFLITGCAGFIGFHLSKLLLKKTNSIIVGVDNINNYYDQKLKNLRLNNLREYRNFKFYKCDLNSKKLLNIFKKYKFDIVINLAAQAGVRYSIKNPSLYFSSNISGFYKILEYCRLYKVKHLIFASTSSVYGNSKKFPIKENDSTDKQISFYAASKKTNETMAHSYSAIYSMQTTALRFFTVYGPFGRPDMSLYKFTKNMIENKKINVFNYGKHIRDFTYIDDVCTSIFKLLNKKNKNKIPFNVFNVASSSPKSLNFFIKIIEKKLLIKSNKIFLPLQKGDIYKTFASNKKLYNFIKFKPKTSFEIGIENFINWYKSYALKKNND
jgi:UDP-glucuronate 4-epimerase